MYLLEKQTGCGLLVEFSLIELCVECMDWFIERAWGLWHQGCTLMIQVCTPLNGAGLRAWLSSALWWYSRPKAPHYDCYRRYDCSWFRVMTALDAMTAPAAALSASAASHVLWPWAHVMPYLFQLQKFRSDVYIHVSRGCCTWKRVSL